MREHSFIETQDGDRYMVDVATYFQYRRKKYEKSQSEGLQNPENDSKEMALTSIFRATKRGDILESTLKLDKFPDTSELLVFPRSIVSYDLRRKRWSELAFSPYLVDPEANTELKLISK